MKSLRVQNGDVGYIRYLTSTRCKKKQIKISQ